MSAEPAKTPDAHAEAGHAEGADAGKKSKFKLGSKKVKILALLIGMMVVYAVVGTLFLPKPMTETSAEETEEGEHGGHEEHGGHGGGGGHGNGHSGGGAEKVEIELGDGSFATTNETAVIGSSIQLRFKLYVTVAESQLEEFKNLANVAHKARVNEAIIEIFRAASQDDLRDPELNVMKQKIREKVNRLLGTTAIIDVVFSGFSKMEQ